MTNELKIEELFGSLSPKSKGTILNYATLMAEAEKNAREEDKRKKESDK